MVYRGEYPYAQMAAQQQQQATLLTLLFAKKRTLVTEQPDFDSPIIFASTSLTQKLIQLHSEPNALETLDRRLFEEIFAEIFDGFGYAIELTKRTKDGGRDIIAVGHKDEIATKYLIECKRPNPGNPVGVGIVRELLGVVEDESASKGILVSTTYFSPEATAFQERNEWRLQLSDMDQVVRWIFEYLKIKGEL